MSRPWPALALAVAAFTAWAAVRRYELALRRDLTVMGL